jgi:alcohol dehydrogenase class IV
VLTNEAEKDKSALYHPLIFPKACIIDPELMVSLPKNQTAFTGFDAFCHAFESTLNPGSGAYVDDLARKAIEIVATNLPVVLDNPANIEARSQMAWADTLAGLCIASAGVTLPHGMGMAIGGLYPHVAHGEALAIVYPACMKFTWESAVAQFAAIGRIFSKELINAIDKEAAYQSCGVINGFIEKIGISKKLHQVNVPENEVIKLAKQSMVLPDYKNNPRVASEEEMIALVRSSY